MKKSQFFLLILFTLGLLLPIYFGLIMSTHSVESLRNNLELPFFFGNYFWENYSIVLTKSIFSGKVLFLQIIFNSLIVATFVAIGKIIFSFPVACVLVFFKFRGKALLLFLVFLTFLLPLEIRLLETLEIVKRLGLLDHYGGIVLPLITSATGTFLLRQHFLSINQEIIEASILDGTNFFNFIRYILLPQSIDYLKGLFIIFFIFGWNQYLWPLIVVNDANYWVGTVAISNLLNQGDLEPNWSIITTSIILYSSIPIIIILLGRKAFFKSLNHQISK